MRLRDVTLTAFGAFCGRALPLAPGLNVVFGPNEAGKSTVHAALYAGLCGHRRGRGVDADQRAFRERYRPWEGRGWSVAATVELADGRVIELHHDLDGKASSRAIDVALGRDVTDEIRFEGAPDASRWLGLDRRAFLATACVRQADVVSVTEQPGLLSEHLQRAAATAGTDATAAAALERIDQHLREQVGQDRAHSTKPLRRAIDGEADARVRLARAREQHEAYVELAARAEELEATAREREGALRAHEAASAERAAQEETRRATRARELAGRHPQAPPDPVAEERAAHDALAALAAWRDRPACPDQSGATAAELRHQLASLPPTPDGDLEPHPTVLAASDALRVARQALEAHAANRPPDPPPAPTEQPEDVLRGLSFELEHGAEQPEDEDLIARREALSRRLDAASRPLPAGWPLAALLGGPLAAGLIAAVAWRPVALAGAAVLALLLVAGAWVVQLQRRTVSLAALHAVEGRLRPAAAHAHRARQARDRAAELGLPVDPASLRALAAEVAAARSRRAAVQEWERRDGEQRAAVADAERQVREALQARDAGPDLDAYRAQCRRRREQAERARLRPTLEQQLAGRERLEAAAGAAQAARDRAEEGLRAAAGALGLDAAGDPDGLAGAVAAWLDDHSSRLSAHRRDATEWSELQNLLDGESLETLEARAEGLAADARRLAGAVAPGLLARARAEPDPTGRADALRVEVRSASDAAAEERGRLGQMRDQVPGVAEAEEALEQAQEELARVRRLQETLLLTRQFLERAQERVHRDIAPVLAGTLRGWLPGVTGGRYVDAAVDPATLTVRVCGPGREWRTAGQLSRGTEEQIYLLLRLALVEHLTARGEVCPLLLDEVTVQSDGDRVLALLRLLQDVSKTHQVVLCTQEERVRAWAEEALAEPQDRLLVLEGPAAAT